MLYLVDAGVLLRAVDRKSPDHADIMDAFRELRRRQDRVSTSAQCIREFWNVSTRPTSARGGYGRSIDRTVRWIASFDRILRILPETPATFSRWRELVERHRVIVVQVHDANLVAVADIYGAGALVTLNPTDFARYPVQTTTPHQIVTSRP